MNFNIITEAPSWMILFCLMAGFIYAAVLYRQDDAFREIPRWLKNLMALLRFTCVTILAILLLTPMIRTIFSEVEKPVIIMVQDQSESVTANQDSAAFKSEYSKNINELLSVLNEDFDVRQFTAGSSAREGIDFSFKDKETDLSAAVDEIRARFAGRNIGAVILATDGIYNKGSNPLYAYPSLKVPVYTIGLGDTTVRKDLLVSRVNHNKTAFFGNTFPVEVTIDARQSSGSRVSFTISKKDKILFTKEIEITSDRMNMIVPVFLEANEKGANRYTVSLSKLENEINYINNSRDFIIDVSDTRLQILLVSGAPHPDTRVIKNVLSLNPGYEVKSVLLSEAGSDLAGINLAILHQVPGSDPSGLAMVEKLRLLKVPVFFISGTQINISSLNKLHTGVTVSDSRPVANEVMAEPVRDFSLFTMEEETFRRISEFPPLLVPFGNYELESNVYTLLSQKIGSVRTPMPLLYFSMESENKTAVLAGEGIWKWQLREYAEHGNNDAVNSLINKTVQYLSTKEKKSPFRVFFKNSYEENEPVVMDAEYYNESGELVNVPEVKINIVNESGRNFPFTFSKTGKAYTFNGSYMPVGNYSFTASINAGNKTMTESGSFTIAALQAELTESIADHNLLRSISDKTGGMFFNQDTVAGIATAVNERNDIRPVSYTQRRLDDVINLKWIFGLIMLLLSAEWLLRKRNGAY